MTKVVLGIRIDGAIELPPDELFPETKKYIQVANAIREMQYYDTQVSVHPASQRDAALDMHPHAAFPNLR